VLKHVTTTGRHEITTAFTLRDLDSSVELLKILVFWDVTYSWIVSLQAGGSRIAAPKYTYDGCYDVMGIIICIVPVHSIFNA
jgi:hypothetical protein